MNNIILGLFAAGILIMVISVTFLLVEMAKPFPKEGVK